MFLVLLGIRPDNRHQRCLLIQRHDCIHKARHFSFLNVLLLPDGKTMIDKRKNENCNVSL